jgi:molybdopterin-containing oxidoreductase family membrane subunit
VNPAGPFVFSVYAHLDELVGGIRGLQAEGFKEFQVFSPVPNHEIEHVLGRKPSPVRIFTLVGGLTGLAIGCGITIGPLWNYSLHVGGKPLVSLPPFAVVAYICTILFGALATFLGMILNARLPQLNLVEGYDERLSSDHFGIQVRCGAADIDRLKRLLKRSGAVEIRQVKS